METGAARAARPGDGPALLERPRLVQAMRLGTAGALTLITAPAGFGKTVLVRQWMAAGASPVGSVTFQPRDDAERLAAKLLSAAAAVGAHVTPTVAPGSLDSPAAFEERFLPGFLQRLSVVGDAALVLDGLDVLRGRELASHLGRLIDEAPPRVHIVATQRSRELAAWLRATHRDAVSLGEHDLVFDRDEVRQLVRHVADRELTDEQLERLLVGTEGWPVGVHIAAVAMRAAVDPDEVIESLRGENRHITAYLREEVLDRQPPAVRQFMVRCSAFDRMSASLCDDVLEVTASRAVLRKIERRGDFVRHAPAEGEWFVAHPMLRHVLRRELHVSEPGAEPELLARAAAWHEQHDDPAAAARYLIEAERWDDLLDLVDRTGRTLFERGDAERVLEWLDRLPIDAPDQRRRVSLRRAILFSVSGNARRAAQELRQGEAEGEGFSAGEQVIADATRATWVTIDATPAYAIEAADAALRGLDAVDPAEIPQLLAMTSPADLRLFAAGSRARAIWYLGDVAGARDALRSLTAETSYGPWRAHLLGSLALLEAWSGNLDVAEREARAALVIAGRTLASHHPATLDAHVALATVLRERDGLLRADEHLNEARAVAIARHRAVELDLCIVERALWMLALGRPERALAELETRRVSGDPPPTPLVQGRLRSAEVRALVSVGDLDAARRVIDRAASPLSAEVAAAAVQAAVARRDVAAARRHLDEWPIADDEPRRRLERSLWSAVVDLEEGRRHQALVRAAQVVAEAEQRGEVRLLLDAGRPAERLLRSLAHVEPTPYLERLLRCMQPVGAVGHAARGLSERELEIVRYLPTPLSSAEIAEQLYISLNTIKTHLRTIYRKLGVSNRREAIVRSEQLGIA